MVLHETYVFADWNTVVPARQLASELLPGNVNLAQSHAAVTWRADSKLFATITSAQAGDGHVVNKCSCNPAVTCKLDSISTSALTDRTQFFMSMHLQCMPFNMMPARPSAAASVTSNGSTLLMSLMLWHEPKENVHIQQAAQQYCAYGQELVSCTALASRLMA